MKQSGKAACPAVRGDLQVFQRINFLLIVQNIGMKA